MASALRALLVGFADGSGLVPAGSRAERQGLVAIYKKLGGNAARATPETITNTGLKRTDEAATMALDVVAYCLARFAGDVALHFGDKGGVYLAGGLPTGIVEV